MSSTLYRNASGLPNDEQLTTAHDLTILGRTLEERFPRYFHYFSTAEFDYDGEIIGNHNHLLGRVDGVDGIKTGYTRASGFNLLTSVHRDGRSLIAVVMGGRSAGGRDRIMENLIADHLAEASTTRTATMIADAAPAARLSRATSRPRRRRRARVRPWWPRASSTRLRRDERGECGRRRRRWGGRRGDSGPADAEGARRRPARSAADCGRSRPAQKSRQRQAVSENPGPAGGGERAGRCRRLDGRAQSRTSAVRRALPSKTRTTTVPRARGSWIDPGRRRRQSRQGQRPFDPRPGTKPFDPRLGQASHRKGAQRRRHPLSRALRGPRFSLGRSGVPFAQAQRIFLLHRPRLMRILAEPV